MTATYAKIIKTLLKSVNEDHKKEIRDKIAEIMIDDTASEYNGPLPYKRKKRDPTSSVTDHFNNAKKMLGDQLFNKFASEK